VQGGYRSAIRKAVVVGALLAAGCHDFAALSRDFGVGDLAASADLSATVDAAVDAAQPVDATQPVDLTEDLVQPCGAVGQPCCSGLCQTGSCCSSGQCVAGTAQAACGQDGKACFDCSNWPGGTSCTSGACRCSTNSDCPSGDLMCLNATVCCIRSGAHCDPATMAINCCGGPCIIASHTCP
jgi:hypothetical protein